MGMAKGNRDCNDRPSWREWMRKGDDDMDDGQEGNIRDPIVQRNSNIKFFS